MTDYANILNALNQKPATGTNPMADLNRRTENYKLVDQLNNEGVSLKEILGQIDDLKKKIEGMEKPRESMDAGVFLAMEAAVRDDPEIISAKTRLSELKSTIILEMCMKDSRYAEAYRDYRAKVSERYVHLTENKARNDSDTLILDSVNTSSTVSEHDDD